MVDFGTFLGSWCWQVMIAYQRVLLGVHGYSLSLGWKGNDRVHCRPSQDDILNKRRRCLQNGRGTFLLSFGFLMLSFECNE